jgi:diguanylate cyclase (GGDEF)-like protein/PAS domain S-box-containing protein
VREDRAVAVDELYFRSVVDNIPGVVYRSECVEPWRMYYLSDYVEAMLGYPAGEFLGDATRTFGSLLHADDVERVGVLMEEVLRSNTSYSLEYRLVRADGSPLWVAEHGCVVRGSQGEPIWLDGVILDASRRKDAERARDEAERLLRHQALHDGLTGLPNRAAFISGASAAIELARAEGLRIELAIMDLDHFKEVNDTLGHANGDRLLQEVAFRAAAMLPEHDLCARLGGDEFAFALHERAGGRPFEVLERLRGALNAPIELEGLPVSIEASLGVARFPEDGESLDELMRYADRAMYQRKALRSGTALHRAVARTEVRRTIASELRLAIEQGELVLHYQPKLDAKTGMLDGVEALLRWPHPDRGLIEPDELIPLAESSSLVRPLTLYVIEEALRQCRAWLDVGRRVPVSVNVWVSNLIDSGLPEAVGELLQRYSIPSGMLKLEISEFTIISDPHRIGLVLERLGGLGVGLSIDSFGNGYATLSSLHRLPIKEVKLDRGLVAGLRSGGAAESALLAAIGLGRDLGFRVVAEGIETAEMAERLRALGSDAMQGFHLCRPLPPAELEAWLDDHFGDDAGESDQPIVS